MIKVYIDGACSGNPGIGGWGIVIIEKDICEVVEHKDLYQYIKIIYELQVLIIKSKNKI